MSCHSAYRKQSLNEVSASMHYIFVFLSISERTKWSLYVHFKVFNFILLCQVLCVSFCWMAWRLHGTAQLKLEWIFSVVALNLCLPVHKWMDEVKPLICFKLMLNCCFLSFCVVENMYNVDISCVQTSIQPWSVCWPYLKLKN
jgi:hypothetical protein